MKFRKKPVVIEATQWNKDGDHPNVVSLPSKVGETMEERAMGWDPMQYRWIGTLEGGHIVSPGDWIITGVQAEQYPCKPDIFAATYEPVDAAAGASPVQPNQGLQSVADALTIEQLNDKVERLMAAQPERTLLEQHDLNQSPEYRKGYEDGRLRGFEVGQRYAKEQAVQPSQAAEFNNAINFAIEQGLGCSDFLRAWREGDASEWPEFDAKGVQS